MVGSEHRPVQPGREIGGWFQVGRPDAWYRNKVHDEIISNQYGPENQDPGFFFRFYIDHSRDKKHNRDSWQHTEDPKVLEIKILDQV